jgi:hypothetical protein
VIVHEQKPRAFLMDWCGFRKGSARCVLLAHSSRRMTSLPL